MSRYQRTGDGGEQRTTALELFYDLVYVYAVTQVSHLLLRHLTWTGAGEALVALLVVWWSWNYTTWVTNELDPDSIAVRLVLIAITLASLLMAVAIPEAFGSRALLFVGAYAAIQVGRNGFLAYAATEAGTVERERSEAVLAWLAAAAVLWLAGGALHGAARVVLWIGAIAVDYSAPALLYRIPGRPRLTSATWEVGTSHFAERFQLFVIIALGESVVVTGATTSGLALTAARVTALGLAFLTTAALWWLYFDYVARIAERRLEMAPNRTTLARDGYTYLHVVLIAGIILCAVGNELVIAHPGSTLRPGAVLAVVAGPAVYLAGHTLFRLRLAGSLSGKRLTGAVACLAAGVLGGVVPALGLAAILLAVLAAVIAWEREAARRRTTRGEPSPLERLEAGGGPVQQA